MLRLHLMAFFAYCFKAAAAATFQEALERGCMLTDVNSTTHTTAINSRQCAIQCFKTPKCTAFQFAEAELSCRVINSTYRIFLNNSTSDSNRSCAFRTFFRKIEVKTSGFAIFNATGKFTVPVNVAVLKVLAVGGGGGARNVGGGGGSGYVQCGVIIVTPGQNFSFIIGAGGVNNRDGSATIFGNNLLIANGGYYARDWEGGAGGSGGGTGLFANFANFSGSGGTGGSDGRDSHSIPLSGGAGQGASFMLCLKQFTLNKIGPGLGAAGISSSNSWKGGGGGGGVLINGEGPKSVPDPYSYTNGYGPGPANGYGAGASGSCYEHGCGFGAGASGLVYIEYYDL